MTIAHFLVLNADDPAEINLQDTVLDDAGQALSELNGVERVDRYVPVEFDDPLDDGSKSPVLTIQTCYSDCASLEQGLDSAEFSGLLNMTKSLAGIHISHDALEMMFFPVADAKEPGEWTAEISYVVRYHHPADNVDEFVNFYITHHPQIERRFPDIRSIMCYVPVKWNDMTGLTRLDYMLGNEVIFDSVNALGNALTSPVMEDMMADFAQFPPFNGRNTHFAMKRKRIF